MSTVALAATQEISTAGIAPAYQGSLLTTNVYTFPNDGRTFLHIKKSGAGACTATVVTPGSYRGQAIADLTFNVPASTGDVMAGPFPADLYTDPATGLATVSFSEITGLTAAVVRLP
jgi:hypothetical protein